MRRQLTKAVLGAAVFAAAGAFAIGEPTAGPGITGARYATDQYPGFDTEESILSPERLEPRWFSFIFGPDRDNAKDQLAYCVELMREEDFSKAAKQLDALVREWPTSPEAPKAQQARAELLYTKLMDFEEAFTAYRYLLDFYSSNCDFEAISDKLYEVAKVMEVEGKEIMFVRFANTVDVRRAYEACVLHSPGAKWVPEAMLKIAKLRDDEGKYTETVKVYENLRNLYPESDQAKTALLREAEARMVLLRDFGYNRERCSDTVNYLTMALTRCRETDAERIRECLAEAKAMLAEEAYLGAKFYDSRTRTPRSAINAYERFLSNYPEGEHADEVRERLAELKAKEEEKK